MSDLMKRLLQGEVFTAFSETKPIVASRSWLARIVAFFTVSRRHARLEHQVATMARTNLELARQVQELHRRLSHHERGPLEASRQRLDNQRSDGVVGPSRIIRV
jgi:hypothetical protein